jgi:TolB-like protein/AraC-like DNA-binding protein/Tfp pilus assembly protein PilF
LLGEDPEVIEHDDRLSIGYTGKLIIFGSSQQIADVVKYKFLMATPGKSIAVLPFVNMSADPENEYFSDGITEEIINVLTRIQGLKVIARTSSFAFKNHNTDIRHIAEKLGVSFILEGSVRKSGTKIRVTAQLINAVDGIHIFSKNYDRAFHDIFAVQDEISERIADQIREEVGHFDIQPISGLPPTLKVEAYDLLLRGDYHLKRKDLDDIKKALLYFDQAIAVDPDYADAYASRGEAYLHAAGFGLMTTREAFGQAKKDAQQAISRQPAHARAYKVMAYVELFFEWDWNAANTHYEKAIQFGLPEQNEFTSYYSIFIEEDFERAIAVAKQAVSVDPLHIIVHWQLGLCYYFARQFEPAIAAFDAALEIDPNFGEALRFRGLVKGYQGRFKEAMIDIQHALETTGGQGLANIDLLIVKILMGKKEEVQTVIRQMTFLDASDPAILYALLDQPDEAMEWLEKAYKERSVMLVSLKNFWVWDNLREDQRFKVIYDRMDFPESVPHRPLLEPVRQGAADTNSSSAMTDGEARTYTTRLQGLIEEGIYTDPSLSLRALATRLQLNPNKLSWLINEKLDKNFNAYINGYRLAHFKKMAIDPKHSHLTLLGMAMESGFNSKTVFNTFFKKMEGQTPRAWVKSRQGGNL